MEKWNRDLIAGVASIIVGAAVGAAIWQIRKKRVLVVTLGGDDGPTSVFLARKPGRKSRAPE